MNEQLVKALIAPGVCGTLWTPRSMFSTLTPRVKRILLESRPQIVCLHGMPESLDVAAETVWGELTLLAKDEGWNPPPRLWIGVACDTILEQTALKRIHPDQAAIKLCAASRVASELNAEMVLWDAEAACKLDPIRTGIAAGLTIQMTRNLYKGLVQGHTAYAVPTYHSETDVAGNSLLHGYPWSSWCGKEGVDVAIPQVYVAPSTPETGPRPFAPPGAFRLAIQTHRHSWAQAQQHGWIREDLPVWMYGQLHHVPYWQTVSFASDPYLENPYLTDPKMERSGVSPYVFCGWTIADKYCDEHGEVAMRALCELARRGQNVADFQRSVGFSGKAIDGYFGVMTATAMGLEVPNVPG